MSIYLRFGRAQADPKHPNGYDERRCRELIDRQLGPLPAADHVILDVGSWAGDPHSWVADALAEYLTPASRVTVRAATVPVHRAWTRELATARDRVTERRRRQQADPAGPAVDWVGRRLEQSASDDHQELGPA